ncbi:MAG: HAD family hydrolase [Anaerolineae bacterium]|nr:HAD family hydrolase [Anaerolineae bacterium]MDW7992099.1 HAD family hydrolase [Anaerolineae bacterium]MDW8069666.1 HAD family hydrolase [Anaerolineae bacterium]
MQRAVFIDRDGVICRNRTDHVKSWEEFVFLPGAKEALARLSHSDFLIIVITNQAIINRGMVPAEAVEEIHRRMIQEVTAAGGRIDRVVYCPHRPDENCGCRKPQPGMLLRTAQEMRIDLTHSWLIGDAWSDIVAARQAGCKRYLVLTGRGRQELIRCWRRGERGFRIALNLDLAVRSLLRQERLLQQTPMLIWSSW